MGLQRFLALGLALGRAIVFSHCTHPGDPWMVGNRQLFKSAYPYQCDEPHLIFGEHYVGHGGIDLRWSLERQKLMHNCGHAEVALDLNSKELPQFRHGSQNVLQNPHVGFYAACTGPSWRSRKGCTNAWNHDQMTCDTRARAGCADVASVFGPLLLSPEATSASKRPVEGASNRGRRLLANVSASATEHELDEEEMPEQQPQVQAEEQRKGEMQQERVEEERQGEEGQGKHDDFGRRLGKQRPLPKNPWPRGRKGGLD